jgi:hypothetical protein
MNIDKYILALEQRTLPKFLYQIDDQWFNFEREVERIGLRNPITFVKEQNAIAQIPAELSAREIFTFFVLNNLAFKEYLSQRPFDAQVADVLALDEGDFGLLQNTYFQISDPQFFQQMVRDELDGPRNAFYERNKNLQRQLEAWLQAAPYTARGEPRVASKSTVFTIAPIDLLETLDKLEVDRDLFMASTRQFFKTHISYTGLIECPVEEEELFLFYGGRRCTLTPTTLTIPQEFDSTAAVIAKLGAPEHTKLKETVNYEVVLVPPDAETMFALDRNVWADLIMNNALIARDFVIDEHVRASKQNIFLYGMIPGGKRQPMAILEEGAAFKLRLFNADGDAVAHWISLVSKLLGVYQTSAVEIAREYNQFLSEPIVLKKLSTRIDIRPTFFLPNYSRTCQYMPRLVSPEEAKEDDRDGFQVLTFPPDQFQFSCSHHDLHIFPGLRANTLSNKEEYPYLPCCFKQDQRTKFNSKLNKYMNPSPEGSVQSTTRRQPKFLKTNKLAGEDQEGKLLLFGVEMVRRGVRAGPASILECLPSKVTRAALARVDLNCLAQEMYDMDERQRRLYIESQPLDASFIFSLLENHCKIRLVVLAKTGFKAPRQFDYFLFLKTNPEWPVCVVYENGDQYEKVETSTMVVEELRKLYVESQRTFSLLQPNPFFNREEVKEQFTDSGGHVCAVGLGDGNVLLLTRLIAPFFSVPASPFRSRTSEYRNFLQIKRDAARLMSTLARKPAAIKLDVNKNLSVTEGSVTVNTKRLYDAAQFVAQHAELYRNISRYNGIEDFQQQKDTILGSADFLTPRQDSKVYMEPQDDEHFLLVDKNIFYCEPLDVPEDKYASLLENCDVFIWNTKTIIAARRPTQQRVLYTNKFFSMRGV